MVELSQNGEPLFEPFITDEADGEANYEAEEDHEEEKVLS